MDDSISHLDRLENQGVYKDGDCPNGDKKKNVENYISLYLVIAELDNLPPCWGVNVNFKLFVYDQIKDRYLTVQDADGAVKRFYAMKTEWRFEKLLSLESFKDPANGYLVKDSCVFGMEVFVIRNTGNWESVSLLNPPLMTNPTSRWEIKEFSKLDQESYQSQAFAVGGIEW
ncbi:E3 ubiquitin-protein ligase SIN-like [Parasponia andersonii]|uniref:E3 ubiquitin-protein ligase SIN-like n=1 Tax=Parasponia andersonii TaxID=3476 RepID=A0A2P5CIS9_PARAD|nr:E3 ubiquitin-protein ligase SIN-like [Parasponia andersonii]